MELLFTTRSGYYDMYKKPVVVVVDDVVDDVVYYWCTTTHQVMVLFVEVCCYHVNDRSQVVVVLQDLDVAINGPWSRHCAELDQLGVPPSGPHKHHTIVQVGHTTHTAHLEGGCGVWSVL